MSHWLVALHVLIEADGPDPRFAIAAALEHQFDHASPLHPRGTIVDWAIAGDDLAGSMQSSSVPPDYVPGKSQFPDWPKSPAARAISKRARFG